MRLDVGMKAERRAKGVLEDARGFLQTRFNVALAPLTQRLNVGQLRGALGRILVRGRIVMQQRPTRPDRCKRIGNKRQLLVLNVNQIQCLLGNLGADRGHRCHGFSNVADSVAGEDRHVFHS